jgi:hypothetical protein
MSHKNYFFILLLIFCFLLLTSSEERYHFPIQDKDYTYWITPINKYEEEELYTNCFQNGKIVSDLDKNEELICKMALDSVSSNNIHQHYFLFIEEFYNNRNIAVILFIEDKGLENPAFFGYLVNKKSVPEKYRKEK